MTSMRISLALALLLGALTWLTLAGAAAGGTLYLPPQLTAESIPGNAPSSTATETLTPVFTPDEPTAHGSGADMVLTWTHWDNTVQHYEVYRSTVSPYFERDSPDAQKLGDVTPPMLGSTIDYSDDGVLDSSEGGYYYRIWAVDSQGLSHPISSPVGPSPLR